MTTTSGATLKRALTLRDLVLYGIIVIQPVAPMSVYGVLDRTSRGHVVTTILIAMVAMLLTAISYGRMAAAYPSAGSAFTYVGSEIHPAAGYITGWSMVMDYMLNPMICIVWCSNTARVWFPMVPYVVFAVGFFVLFTYFNLRGVEASAKFNTVLASIMGLVILLFLGAVVRYLISHGHEGGVSFFLKPFYDPSRWNTGAVLQGTSIAVLTYIGFDGISTLSEEVENPRRNILLATAFTCLAIGILSAIEVYAAQLVWPGAHATDETAFADAAMRAGGATMGLIITITLMVANTGSGTGAQLGAARLLFSMGRSGALPPKFFAYIDPKRRVPRNNILFVGGVALVGALILQQFGGFGLGAELLNFGALIAFMGVNLASLVRYFIREPQKKVASLLIPGAGFAICLLLFLNLSRTAKIAGVIWMAVGLAFGAWKTRGFRGNLVTFDAPTDS